MTTFLLIRHGLTDAVGHVMTGHEAGVHLNATGRDQAASLPQRLGMVPLHAIYASPLERTRETAQPVADARGLASDGAFLAGTGAAPGGKFALEQSCALAQECGCRNADDLGRVAFRGFAAC